MSSTNTATTSKWTQDNTKTCDHCNNKGHVIENCYKLECEKQAAQQCEQCKEYGHAKAKCPKTPDSPRTQSIKYDLYIHGGIYQGKKHYGGDYQGGAEYLSEQINLKVDLMTPEEYEKYKEEISDLDDDYIWSCF
jgi:hypothetical protein